THTLVLSVMKMEERAACKVVERATEESVRLRAPAVLTRLHDRAQPLAHHTHLWHTHTHTHTHTEVIWGCAGLYYDHLEMVMSGMALDRKSTRLNSSHTLISY